MQLIKSHVLNMYERIYFNIIFKRKNLLACFDFKCCFLTEKIENKIFEFKNDGFEKNSIVF